MALIVIPVAILLLVVPLSLYYAWASSILWGWFIVPLFGLPEVSVLQMWGVMLFLSLLKPNVPANKSDTEAALSNTLSFLCSPLLALGIGYVLRFWWMA
jgi:predicted branched-subunit amino acid permease